MKRLITLAGVCLLAGTLHGQVTRTTIAQTITTGSGNFSGTVEIEGPSLTTSDNVYHLGEKKRITVTNGAFTVDLWPNVGSNAGGQRNAYRVTYYGTGKSTVPEWWIVPVSATPITIAQMAPQTTPPPFEPLTINWASMARLGATDGQAIRWSDAAGAWVPGTSGTGDVIGQASSVDGEIALFSGTNGKTIKRASATGVPKLTSGVLGVVSGSSTDCVRVDGTSTACEPAISAGTTGQVWRGDKSWVNISALSIGWSQLTSVPSTFTPSAHASSHKNGGSDEIATATPAANAIPKAGAGGTLGSGWIPDLSATYQPLDADLTTLGGLAKTDNNLIVANGSTWILTQLPSCSNATTSKLLYDTTTRTFSCGTDQAGGGTSLPDQTGNSGKFLTTNGTTASWDWALDTLDSGGSSTGRIKAVKVGTGMSFAIASQIATLSVDTANLLTLSGTQTFSGKTTDDLKMTVAGVWTRERANAGTGGTAINLLAKLDSSGNAITIGTGDTAVPAWVVVGGAGTAGNALLAWAGRPQLYTSNACTIGQYVVASTTTAGRGSCTSSPTAGVFVYGYAAETTGGAGLAYVHVLSAPYAYSAGGTGDVTGQSSSVDSEIALFSGAGGKTIKRATTTGLLKANSGVLEQAISGTDYAPATSGSSILKGNGSGGFSNAASGTDYAPATSGTGILKGNGSGGFSTATSGTDYSPAAVEKMRSGTSLPGTCAAGDLYFKTDATSGTRLRVCDAANTWHQVPSLSGSGAGVLTLLEGSAPAAGANAGEHNLGFDSSDSKLKSRENGGSLVTYASEAWVAAAYLALSGGTLTGQLVTAGSGIEFGESDTNPACAAGNFSIYADLSENKLKKCQNGTASDLDTTSAGGGMADPGANGVVVRTALDTTTARTITGTTDQISVTNGDGVSGNPTLALATNARIRSFGITINGGGSAITSGLKGCVPVEYAGTIQQVTALADQSGSIIVDIWKDTYANYPPTDADSITSATPVTITTATKAQDATLTNWTKTHAAGDIFCFNVDSATTVQQVVISVKTLIN